MPRVGFHEWRANFPENFLALGGDIFFLRANSSEVNIPLQCLEVFDCLRVLVKLSPVVGDKTYLHVHIYIYIYSHHIIISTPMSLSISVICIYRLIISVAVKGWHYLLSLFSQSQGFWWLVPGLQKAFGDFGHIYQILGWRWWDDTIFIGLV